MESIRSLLPLSIEYLEKHGIEKPRREIEELLCHILKCDRLTLYTDHDKPLQPDEVDQFREAIKQKSKHVPLAYIVGHIPFFGATLKVTKDVLIPRVETEQLVEQLAKSLKGDETLLDLCTGSGCIGISLKKKFPNLKVILSDISEKALSIANENTKLNGVEATLLLGNFLEPLNQKVDIVVCNPPYVTAAEYEDLDPSVKNFEPVSALVAEDNGLYFYKKLAKELPNHLNPHGSLWLEIGSTQGKDIQEIFNTAPWKSQKLMQDLSDRDRIFNTHI